VSDNKLKIQKIRNAKRKSVRLKVRAKKIRVRLAVFRTSRHIYAQIIDDKKGHTLTSSSTVLSDFRSQDPLPTGMEAAKWVGMDLAEKALAKGIKQVVFDRGAYRFHGRIKALAEAAREKGLEF